LNPAPTRALRLWFKPHQQATSHEQLVQILLPTRDNRGRKFKSIIFGRIRKELVGRFGGLTAYSPFPACGVWKSGQSSKLDDIVVTEIVTAELNGVGGKNIDASWSVRSASTRSWCACRRSTSSKLPIV
jgi:hypothetical protein